jgi:hypothetical protein
MLPKRRPRVSERDSREEAKKSDEGAGAVDDGSTSECLQIYEISAHVISPGYSSKDNATADQYRFYEHVHSGKKKENFKKWDPQDSMYTGETLAEEMLRRSILTPPDIGRKAQTKEESGAHGFHCSESIIA